MLHTNGVPRGPRDRKTCCIIMTRNATYAVSCMYIYMWVWEIFRANVEDFPRVGELTKQNSIRNVCVHAYV